ncbi:MAG TPA: hypothetical protein PLO23_03285 [Alphaproteobacteria bacterium]|nr:hypothetical protein [Alphaproteobacteria bacterium]
MSAEEKINQLKQSFLASCEAKGRTDGAAVWQGYMDRWAETQAWEPRAEFQLDWQALYPGSQYCRAFNLSKAVEGSPERIVDYGVAMPAAVLDLEPEPAQ